MNFKLSIVLATLIGINGYGFDFGKIIEDSVKRTDRKAERKVERKIDSGVDAVFNKIEGIFSDKSKEDTSKKDAERSDYNSKSSSATESKSGVIGWNRYDFVPGDRVIFEDDLRDERNGEFPSQWDMIKGVFENATLDGENVIVFIKGNTNGGAGIVPLLKNSNKDYLPDQFTLEFDAYFEKESESQHYKLWFSDLKNQGRIKTADNGYIEIKKNSMRLPSGIASYYPGTNSGKSSPTWRHISVSFNTRALKVYLDDVRLLNVPNLGYNPTGVTIGFMATEPRSHGKGYIKNIRIAQGAVPLYDKMMSDGKIVTTGIRFDVNRATIKAESAGVINEIVALMKQNPSVNFSIEGHTDSDGDDRSNQRLSEERAEAVKNAFLDAGIDESRLKTRGWGESKPLGDNSTHEGKANNRRVE
ncbi:MAG: OmpA family protein, partial [Campylobacterales bacterium]|nr:OmpA family protein [Campylobacterales bacterium]